jgi:hypothetical protein
MTVWRQRFAGEELRCGLAPDRRLEQTVQGAPTVVRALGRLPKDPRGSGCF